jgi:cell wall-associated NlpC family hydrolase
MPVLRALIVAAGFGLASGAVLAGPESSGEADPMSRLLAERGLLPAAAALPAGTSPAGAGGAVGEAPTPAAAPSLARQIGNKASELVVSAMNFLGVPYRRGGTDAQTGFDCSGFTQHLFELTFGLVLPRRVDDQAHAPGLVKVTKQELKPGDLVFFNTLRRTFSHVGIYVGEGRFIHSPRSGAEVRVEDMGARYWTQRFTGARRLAGDTSSAATVDASRVAARAGARPSRAGPTPVAATLPAAAAPALAATGPQSNWQP